MMEEEPLMLQEMRVAYRGARPETAGEVNAVRWFADDPKGFRIHLAGLEKEWLIRKDKLESRALDGISVSSAAWDGQGPCPVCKRAVELDDGSVRCVEVCGNWLKENS